MSEYHITHMASARIPTRFGEFQLRLYRNNQDAKEHLALVLGDVADHANVLTRIHSECFTGDVLGSLRCDCGEQLEHALEHIATEGAGVLLYLRQEGRGIGLLAKLRAYNLQDEGYDTVDANLALGHRADERDYTPAVAILRDLGICSVRLITNNPTKLEALRELNVPVVARVPLPATVHAHNKNYLDTKARRMRHILPVFDVIGSNGNH
jgi:GTP cyclohydrolase II